MTALHQVSYAWRTLRRAPVFSITVVLAFTIGIGSAAAIFAIVNGVLLRPLPFGHSDRLVAAWHSMPALSMDRAPQTPGTFFTYRRFASSLAGIGVYSQGSANVADPDGRGAPERMSVSWTSRELIPLLEVPPLLGRTFSAQEDAPKGPDVVIISAGVWRSHFGGARDVIGKKLLVFGKPTEIIGVMPATFRFPSRGTQLWLPLQLDPTAQYTGGFSYPGVARLKPGVTIAAAQREMQTVLPRMVQVSPMLAPGVTTQMVLDQAKPIVKLVPLRDDVVGGIARTLWVVAAAAVLVLLVTCANVANLLLVRADARHRELAVRSALGAGRGRMIMHFLVEAALLATASCALGLGAAYIAIRALVAAGPADIPRLAEIHVDAATVAFTIVTAALVALACSAIPAIRFMRSDALSGLREGTRGGTAGASRQRAQRSRDGADGDGARGARGVGAAASQLPAPARRAARLQRRRRRDVVAFGSRAPVSERQQHRSLLRPARRARPAAPGGERGGSQLAHSAAGQRDESRSVLRRRGREHGDQDSAARDLRQCGRRILRDDGHPAHRRPDLRPNGTTARQRGDHQSRDGDSFLP
jgi:predicted permease